jgi:hypothetical protein
MKLRMAVLTSLFVAGVAWADDKGEVEVEGPVAQPTGTCPALSFEVNGTKVVTNEKTDFDDGTCADVAKAKKVEVEGKKGADGVVVATEVDIDR